MIKFLKNLKVKVDNYEEGYINPGSVEREVYQLSYHFTVFLHESGLYGKEKKRVQELEQHLEAMVHELEGAWNSSRKVVTKEDNEDTQKRGTKRPAINRLYSTPKKFCKIIYKDVSPKEQGDKIKCQFCVKTFDLVKSLIRHMKQKHPAEVIDPELKNQDDRITCRLCNNNTKFKHTRDQIGRHLATVHGVKKPHNKSFLKGWATGNDGIIWKAVFRASYEQDPPTDTLVETVRDRNISLFGCTFEPEECNIFSLEGENEKQKIDVDEDDLDVGLAVNMDIFQQDVIEKEDLDQFIAENNVDHHEKDEESQVSEGEVGGSSRRCLLEENLSKPASSVVARKLFDVVVRDKDEGRLVNVDRAGSRSDQDKKKISFSVKEVKIDDDISVDDGQVDSDHEDGDAEKFTEERMSRKLIRQENRSKPQEIVDLDKLPHNAGFIERFEKWMNNRKLDTSNTPEKLSTLRKQKGHLFTYHDSYLVFETKKDPLFSLDRLVNPKREDFLEISNPLNVEGWISSLNEGGKQQPIRRKECLKVHARLREFLEEELSETNFGKTSEDYIRKEGVLKHLREITNKITKGRTFRTLDRLEKEEKVTKAQAKKVIYPNNDFNEAKSVVKWFKSEQAQQEEKEAMDIYDKAIKGGNVCGKEFCKFGNWVRFTCLLEDRNRQGAYGFTNLEYMNRIPKWLPPRETSDDRGDAERFDKLPDNWDADKPPKEGAEPSVWVITVSGRRHALKGNVSAELILTRRGEEICKQYRDVKFACLDDEEDENSSFFVNMKGKPLTKIKNQPGSLLEKLGEVCGVENPTVNTFRRATEVQVQASPIMKQAVNKIQLHSAAVGEKIYDKSGSNTRANFFHQLADMESPQKVVKDVPVEVSNKRVLRERKDREKVIKRAKTILEEDKKKKTVPKSKKNKIIFDEKIFLDKILCDEIVDKIGVLFPGRIFYLMFDSHLARSPPQVFKHSKLHRNLQQMLWHQVKSFNYCDFI